jgi:hypothetical protein
MDTPAHTHAEAVAAEWRRRHRATLARVVNGGPPEEDHRRVRPAIAATGFYALGVGLDFLLLAVVGRPL